MMKEQILNHAKQCEPQESCGFVVNVGGIVNIVVGVVLVAAIWYVGGTAG